MRIGYRPEIDGLRALAVIPVLLFHAGVPWFEGGFLGVDVFFVISGYLITRILDDRQARGEYGLASFYEQRIRRIAPALIFVVTCTFILAIAMVPPWRLVELSKSIIAAGTFTANFFFLSQDVYFATPSDYLPLQHLWSLAVEEQFYIVYPLLFLLLARFSNLRRAWVLAGLGVASLVLSHYVASFRESAAFFRPDTRAWEILLGALCVFVPPLPGRLRAPAALLGVALILLAYFGLPAPVAPTVQSLPVCLGAALVILAAGGDNLAGRVLGLWPLTFVGLISYSLYLWHQPLLALARIANFGGLSGSQTALVLAACLGLSLVTWHFVERPARDRQWISRRQIFTGALAAFAILLAGAILAMATSGLAFRYGRQPGQFLARVDPMDDTDSGRTAAIGMGVCHYRLDLSPPRDTFLQAWQCEGDATGQGILVVGDSHAADIAGGYRMNGLNVGQMTGAGCHLAPKKMDVACRALFDHVLAKGAPFKVLVMALDQTAKPLSAPEMDDLLAYWAPMHLPIVWLSDMPQFPAIKDRRQHNQISLGDDRAGSYPVRLDEARANFLAVKTLAAGRFEVINTADLYCSLSQGTGQCLPYVPGSGWLAQAAGHLTPLGARLFVARMLATQ